MIRSQSGLNRVNIPIAFILTISCLGGAFIHSSYHKSEATTMVGRTKHKGFTEKLRSGWEYSPGYDPDITRLSTIFKSMNI
jgi:hypothetical protein